ncbi:MAG: phosphatase PAP2 family protein [FCB group bacterium]|nr:phosphatase PAP2 family protein [FCB group bacterium]
MIAKLLNLDRLLFQFINTSLANPIFDWIMPLITNPLTLGLPLLLGCVWLVGKGGRRGQIAVVLLIIAVSLTDSIAAQIIKPLVGRLRPSHAMTEGIRILVAKGGRYGFVSNHAANSFALATILSYFYRSYKRGFFTLATLVSFSRIYVGVHYPADVMVGALFGYLSAWGILTAWVLIKMRELKRGRTWAWYAGSAPPES